MKSFTSSHIFNAPYGLKRRKFLHLLGGVSLCTFLPSITNASERTDTGLRIGHLADPHIGTGEASINGDNLRAAVDLLNELHPDVVLVCGDLCDLYGLKHALTLRSILSRLKAPFHLVPGNHDLGMIPTAATLRKYRETLGPDYHDFRIGKWVFAGVNTQLWQGGPHEEQLQQDQWLNSVLTRQKPPEENIIVFGHMPLFTGTADEEHIQNVNIPPEIRKRVLTLFRNSQISAYLCGHLHHHMALSYEGFPLVTAETTCCRPTDSPESRGFKFWNTQAALKWQSISMATETKTESYGPGGIE